MSEIFVSYARSSQATAQQMAQALRALGYGVWRDDELPAHRAYSEVIEERLRAAKAVVVLWSEDAAKSQWVRAEADFAREAGTLVQLNLDGTSLPLPFNQIQCADVRAWSGEADHEGWRKVMASIEALLGKSAAPGAVAPPSVAVAQQRLLAVLAFDNLSDDQTLTYFSDGVSEEILQTVSRMPDLKVLGRSSSFQFRGQAKSIANIRRELQATHVLDGSVRRSGDRVRITASLVECAGQTTLWSNRFDRDLSDVFALQDEIAAAVAEALELVFAPAPVVRKVDPRAYDLYLKARSLAGAYVTHRECMELLESATALAPDLAEAWASLALAYADAGWRAGPEGFDASRKRAVRAIDRANALDSSLGLTAVVRSLLLPPAAYSAREALLNQALASAPSDPEILKQASDFAGAVGRTRECFTLIARAHEVDPLNPIMANRHGGALSEVGLFRECYEAAEIGRQRWPDFDWCISSPLLISACVGDWAVADPLIALAEKRGGPGMQALVGLARSFRDPTPEAQQALLARGEAELAKTGTVEFGQILFIHRIGLPNEAFDLLARASYQHLHSPDGRPPDSRFLQGVIFGALAGTMRRDPRFIDLCDKLGLCDYWTATGKWPDCEDEVRPFYDLRAEVSAAISRRPA